MGHFFLKVLSPLHLGRVNKLRDMYSAESYIAIKMNEEELRSGFGRKSKVNEAKTERCRIVFRV